MRFVYKDVLYNIRKINNQIVINADFKESEHPRDEDGKFTKGAGTPAKKEPESKPTERPYGNKKVKENLIDAHTDKSKEKEMIDFIEKYYHLYHDSSLGRELETFYKYHAGKSVDHLLSSEQRAKKEEINKVDREIEETEDKIQGLKLPKKLSPESLQKQMGRLGFKRRDYLANTGSYYLKLDFEDTPFANDEKVLKRFNGETSFVISLRDHYQHNADNVRPDFDIMVDRNYNWLDTFEEISQLFNLESPLLTKVKKYQEYEQQLKDLKVKKKELEA